MSRFIDANELMTIADGQQTKRTPKEIALAALEIIKEKEKDCNEFKISAWHLIDSIENGINSIPAFKELLESI